MAIHPIQYIAQQCSGAEDDVGDCGSGRSNKVGPMAIAQQRSGEEDNFLHKESYSSLLLTVWKDIVPLAFKSVEGD